MNRLVVPFQRADAPDLTLIFENNVPVTLPGWAWLFKSPKKYDITDLSLMTKIIFLCWQGSA